MTGDAQSGQALTAGGGGDGARQAAANAAMALLCVCGHKLALHHDAKPPEFGLSCVDPECQGPPLKCYTFRRAVASPPSETEGARHERTTASEGPPAPAEHCDSHRRDGTRCTLELGHDGEHQCGAVTWKGRAKRVPRKAAGMVLADDGGPGPFEPATAAELESMRSKLAAELDAAIARAQATRRALRGELDADANHGAIVRLSGELREDSERANELRRELAALDRDMDAAREREAAERARQARPPAVVVEVPATYRDPGSELEARAAELEELLPHLETAHENSKRLAGGIFGFIAGQTAWALEHARMAVSELRHAAELARKQAGGVR